MVVTAIVAIAHHHHWFDPIDTYAFFVVSHFLGGPPRRDVPPRVVVASIDQPSYEQDYEERSPLNRCQLLAHLRTIYEPPPPTPKPTLVVVDVDLSPIKPLKLATEKPEAKPTCQDKLKALFVEGRKAQIKTVLMKPFDVDTKEDQKRQRDWKDDMRGAGVQFGDATLPSYWGVTIKHYCEDRFLAAAAYLVDPPGSSSRLSGSCLSGRSESARKSFIDPVHYLAHIEIVPVTPGHRLEFKDRIADALDKLARASHDGRRVVFFGGGWGESDTYVTPVGELYGVEVHAAAFLSIGRPLWDMAPLFSALSELLIAIMVGVGFTVFWRRYFSAAMDASPAQREHSIVWLVALAGLTLVSIIVFVLASWFLLYSRLWLSPIPLIAGMSIDAFVESLREAVLAARPEAPEGDHGASARLLFEYSRRTVAETTPQGVVESVEEEATWVSPDEAPAHNRVPLSLWVYKYFWGEDLYQSSEPNAQSAAWLRFLKRLAGLVIVLYACWLVLPG